MSKFAHIESRGSPFRVMSPPAVLRKKQLPTNISVSMPTRLRPCTPFGCWARRSPPPPHHAAFRVMRFFAKSSMFSH